MPQSTLISPRPIAARSASTFSTSGCTLKFAGTVVMRSARRLISASGSAVSARVGPLLAEERRPVDRVLALEVGQHRVGRVLAGVDRGAQRLDHRRRARRAAARLARPACRRTACACPGCCAIFLYISGCVRLGVSCSLWPSLRKADDVDHDVLLELHAVVERDLRAQHHRFRIVAVHVQHRRLDHLDDVGAVQRRAAVARVAGGEADLVVDHQVHRAAGVVAARLRQRQRLHHHALAGEGGVAVHQHRQHLIAHRCRRGGPCAPSPSPRPPG